MLLKKMIIKNYRGVENELIIDFSVSNKAKEKLSNNYLFRYEDKDLIPVLVGFIGKNASGKSSILKSLIDTLHLTLEPKKGFTNFYRQYINNNFEKLTDKKQIIRKWEEINKKIDEFTNYNFKNQKKLFPKHYQEFLNWKFRKYSNHQKSSVKINLIFKNKKDQYEIGFTLEKNNLIFIKKKNGKEYKDKFPLINYEVISYCETFYDEDFYLQFQSPYWIHNQFELLKKIGLKKYNDLLSMIDHNVNSIIPIKNHPEGDTTYETIKMENGSTISYSSLSTGTKKLLYFVYKIMCGIINSFNEPKINLIIADEIDNALHIKLVDFIFKLITHKTKNQQLIFATHSPLIIDLINKHAFFAITTGENLEVEKAANKTRENNSITKKFLIESFSSHPSSSKINEVLRNLKEIN